MRHHLIGAFILLLLAAFCLPGTAARADADVTVMFYFDGSDLESDDGSVTADINEILYANVRSNVNLILCTGGTKKWQNTVMNAETNQYYRIADSELVFLQDAGKKDMTEPDTLSEFITFCAENYPAQRNILIMWDHGGGSLYGFGMDERFDPDKTLKLDDLAKALDSAGVHFDIIGFDACLMATAETARSVMDSADYLIASEETEPGDGWAYTNWLNRLSADTAISSEALGKVIIDDFMKEALAIDPDDTLTLSMVNLAAFKTSVLPRLWTFSTDTSAMIDGGSFSTVSRARSSARSYGANDYDQIDLADFASRLDTDSADALIKAIDECVVYSRMTHNMDGSTGLAIYFPYKWLYELNDMIDTYEGMGWDESYLSLIGSFASMQAGGRQMAEASGSAGDSDSFEDYGWYSSDFVNEQSDYLSSNQLNGDEMDIHLKQDDYYALSLSDQEWDLISDAQLQVFLDDGEGYIDLGSDDVFNFDDDGDLIVEFDYTWVALNGATVVYYADDYVHDGDYFCYTGHVPAEVNGRDAEIVLSWDSEHDGGYVRGVRYPSHGGVSPRGLSALKDGDIIQPWCEYYTKDGDLDGTYYFGEEIIVNGDVKVTYDNVGDYDTAIRYMLVDIYGNSYWTEFVYYE